MKTLLRTVLFALTLVVANAKAGESPISVSVAIPAHNGERRVEYRDQATHFHVIVSNTSDKPQRIWREWCSWGYFGLTFEFTDEHGKKWVTALGLFSTALLGVPLPATGPWDIGPYYDLATQMFAPARNF